MAAYVGMQNWQATFKTNRIITYFGKTEYVQVTK